MNILLLAPQPFYQHRGTPIAVKLLSKVLANNGHRIDILTYHEGQNIDIPNVRIHRIPSIPGVKQITPGPSWKKLICDVFLFARCLTILRKKRFDIIHGVEESAFMANFVKLLYQIPFVYDMDSSFAQQLTEKYEILYPIKKIFRLLEKSAVRNSVGVVAVCKYLENIVHDYDPLKIVVRLEDISLLQKEFQDDDIVKETLNIDGTIIMYVGNLEKYQGIDLLLTGFKGIAQKKERIHLVIIGGSEPDIRLYKKKSIQLGINSKTHFMGPRSVSQLSSFLDQADILVSPRIMGANTPMKIYSYLDSGKPIIATRLPTHTQVLDEECAVLVDPTEAAMAEGFLSLLENPDFADSIARFAKERARYEFSFDTFKNKLLDFYSQVEKQIASVPGNNLRGQFLKT